MFKFKRLYTFIIQTFFPVFMMTFVICLFIVLMQFIWKYVEDMVGKGLDNSILAELFFYAALGLIPLALPLAILLAALMSFGNLGERMELAAIKAAGVPLLKAMKPLIIFMIFLSIGTFFFQNEAMPRINVKSRSLLISVKQKSPELDIPEGAFYSAIPNYSLYVGKKNKETKMLHEVMIYDTSEGFDNMSVFVCDSANMLSSADKKHLLLTLFDGQRFANFREANLNTGRTTNNQFVPYGRENFKKKEIIITYNSDFNRMQESNLEGTQIAKNIAQLEYSVDSMKQDLDSLTVIDRESIARQIYIASRETSPSQYEEDYKNDSVSLKNREQTKDKLKYKALAPKLSNTYTVDFDSLYNTQSSELQREYLSAALNSAENSNSTFIFQSVPKSGLQLKIRQHQIEWHKKFALSFACLIFFFIGAPLGAIIRKGGLGMPTVISVLLFIVYYIIDNIGYKLARDGVWEVWQGVWLSSFILFPLGVFLTYKAMNDSDLFNIEAYGKFIRKALRINTKSRAIAKKEQVDVSTIPHISTIQIEAGVLDNLKGLDDNTLFDVVQNYRQYGYTEDIMTVVLSILKDRGTKLDGLKIETKNIYLAEQIQQESSKNRKVTIATYLLSLFMLAINEFTSIGFGSWSTFIPITAYIIFYTRDIIFYSDFRKSINEVINRKDTIMLVLGFLCYFVLLFYIPQKMKRKLGQ